MRQSVPVPSPVQTPSQAPVQGLTQEPKRRRGEAYGIVYEVAQYLVRFAPLDIQEETGFSADSVKCHLRTLVFRRMIVRTSKGRYRWIGPAKPGSRLS